MAPQQIAVTTEVGGEGAYKVDVPLDPTTLLPRLHDIGIWLVEWKIPPKRECQCSRITVVFASAFPRRALLTRFTYGLAGRRWRTR
jgi:hypothetical protein